MSKIGGLLLAAGLSSRMGEPKPLLEWNGKSLPEKLTTTEFLIVKELAKRPGIIKESAQLMDIAYKDNNDIEDRTIDSHVKRISKKFKKVVYFYQKVWYNIRYVRK